MSRAGFLIADTMTRLKSGRCLGPAKGTCWTKETYGRSKKPGRRHQQQWRSQIVVTHFGKHWWGNLPTIVEKRALSATCRNVRTRGSGLGEGRILRRRILDFQVRKVSNRSSNLFAIFRSAVSKPSVKRSYTGASSSRASLPRPWSRHIRARLMAARSSQDKAS